MQEVDIWIRSQVGHQTYLTAVKLFGETLAQPSVMIIVKVTEEICLASRYPAKFESINREWCT